MDAERFDRIAKSFAARASRRRLLRGLAALGLGSGVLGPNHAGARRAPGGAEGSGATIERTDPACKGQPAVNNTVCEFSLCSFSINCQCAESAQGRNKCVAGVRCPVEDECDRNRDCGPGQVCVKVGGCCGGSRKNACIPACV